MGGGGQKAEAKQGHRFMQHPLNSSSFGKLWGVSYTQRCPTWDKGAGLSYIPSLSHRQELSQGDPSTQALLVCLAWAQSRLQQPWRMSQQRHMGVSCWKWKHIDKEGIWGSRKTLTLTTNVLIWKNKMNRYAFPSGLPLLLSLATGSKSPSQCPWLTALQWSDLGRSLLSQGTLVSRVPSSTEGLATLKEVFCPPVCSLRAGAWANTPLCSCSRSAKSRSLSLTLWGFLIPWEFSVLYALNLFASIF